MVIKDNFLIFLESCCDQIEPVGQEIPERLQESVIYTIRL